MVLQRCLWSVTASGKRQRGRQSCDLRGQLSPKRNHFRRLVVIPWLVVARSGTSSCCSAFVVTATDKNTPRRQGVTRQYSSRSSNSAIHLFFERSKSVDGTVNGNQQGPQRSPPRVSSQTFQQLQSPNVTFPFLIQFEEDSNGNDGDEVATPTSRRKDELQEYEYTVRCMQPTDLPDLVPMCLAEFGEDVALQGVSWRQLPAYWEQFCFQNIVTWTLRLKMNRNADTKHQSTISDPAMLVLTRKTTSFQGQQQSTRQEEKVIGMVELSLQPPDLNRNPPAIPMPTFVKESLAQKTQLGSLQGWITNVLIDPDFRGRKFAKVLMLATEGIAKSWGCDYIFLHADADIRSGRIPQKLYESLGYKMVPSSGKEDFSWAGEGLDLFSSVRMVDGVALICYSKEL